MIINKRSGKFYRKNEKEVMERLGLRPVPGSGSGWISKEDGENDEIICQLKSTDRESISIKKVDIDMLVNHAIISHKIPVFAIQFLSDDSLYLMVRPEDLGEAFEYISGGRGCGKVKFYNDLLFTPEPDDIVLTKPKVIASSPFAMVEYHKKREEEYKSGVKKRNESKRRL